MTKPTYEELERQLAEANAEVIRLNSWADRMTDAMLKERGAADAYIKELRNRAEQAEQRILESQRQEPATFGLWLYVDSHEKEMLDQRVFPFKEFAHEHINEIAAESTLEDCGFTKWPTVIPLYRSPIIPPTVEEAVKEEWEANLAVMKEARRVLSHAAENNSVYQQAYEELDAYIRERGEK